MTAALTQPQASPRRDDGLQPVRFTRDLHQIADLVEVCFAAQMDSGGRAAVNEMRALSYVWPMIWLLALLDPIMPGLGSGFVWRSEGKVVGNTSLYRGGKHPEYGAGYFVANVAVHPDYRRRGIALGLMEAAIAKAQRERGRWIALEVEASNTAAINLYHELGFETMETLAQWDVFNYVNGQAAGDNNPFWPDGIHMRAPSETQAEADLIYRRARRGAMAWTHPIERHDVWDSLFDGFNAFFKAMPKEHWVLEDHKNPARLIGSVWVENSGWRTSRVSQFLDPALDDSNERLSLLKTVLGRTSFDGWSIKLETLADDLPIDEYLTAQGFRLLRKLTQMRLHL